MRCYKLWNVNGDEYCVCVVARNGREAKKLFWPDAKFDLCMDRYTDLRVRHMPDVNVDDFTEPQILGYKDGLRRGAYGWVDDNCDLCDSIKYLTLVDGRCLCSDCEEDFYDSQVVKERWVAK